MSNVIWTPEFYGRKDFHIYLSGSFAKELIETETTPEKQQRMNELANNDLKRFNINWLNPYTFHKGSCFLTQIYIGQNGKELHTDLGTISDLLSDKTPEEVKFNTHNIDTTDEVYTILYLFQKWIQYTEIIKR